LPPFVGWCGEAGINRRYEHAISSESKVVIAARPGGRLKDLAVNLQPFGSKFPNLHKSEEIPFGIGLSCCNKLSIFVRPEKSRD